MTGKTHLATGILTGEAVILATNQISMPAALFAVSIAAIGSLLPDIDHPQSMLSTASFSTRAISSSISAVTKHRGFTHTPVFLICIVMIVNYLMDGKVTYSPLLTLSLCAGMLSHLLLDTLNEKGIMWLWPLWKRPLHLACVRTGSKVENVLCIPINIAATGCLIYIMYLYILQVIHL